MKVLVAVCFVKNISGGIDTNLQAELIEASSKSEALGIMVAKKPNDRQLGCFLAKEIK